MNSTVSLFVRLAAWVLPALVAACSALSAQTFDGGFDRVLAPGAPTLQAGPYAGAVYTLHDGRFVTTERNVVCCEFNEGRGFGPAAGIKVNVAIGETFFLAPSAGYEARGGTFESTPEVLPIFGRGNRVEPMTFQSTLDVSLATLDLELLAGYRLGTGGLYLTAGPTASIVVGEHYTKSERIVDPAGVVYLDGSTGKELYDGDMDLVRPVMLAARGGIGASIAIADGITLNPELLYALPIGPASREDEWSIAGIRTSVALMFDL